MNHSCSLIRQPRRKTSKPHCNATLIYRNSPVRSAKGQTSSQPLPMGFSMASVGGSCWVIGWDFSILVGRYAQYRFQDQPGWNLAHVALIFSSLFSMQCSPGMKSYTINCLKATLRKARILSPLFTAFHKMELCCNFHIWEGNKKNNMGEEPGEGANDRRQIFPL